MPTRLGEGPEAASLNVGVEFFAVPGPLTAITRLASAHQQDIVDLSRKPKMIKDLPHRGAEFGIEPIQECRLGWDNEIIINVSGRGEQGCQHLVSKKKQSTNSSKPSW
jgi:hypothetical protein